MDEQVGNHERVFKTNPFAKLATKAGIDDGELCKAIRQVILGQADDLGGGVYKKRLSKNQHRSIVLAKGGRYWVFAFLYAKQDKANIDRAELAEFRKFASLFAAKSDAEIAMDLVARALTEICHDDDAQVQE